MSHTPNDETREGMLRLKDYLATRPTTTFRDACIETKVSYRSAYRYAADFGIDTSNIDRPPHPNSLAKFTKEAAIEAFKEECEAQGWTRPTSLDWMNGRGLRVSYLTLHRLFGSWDAVLEAAGVEPIRWRTHGLPARSRLTNADLLELGVIS